MKNMMRILTAGIVALSLQGQHAMAQSYDEERMTRDIEVAENVLATLIKHQMSNERSFFGIDIQGAYQPGYGVTFRLPGNDFMGVITFAPAPPSPPHMGEARVITHAEGYEYSFRTGGSNREEAGDDQTVRLRERAQNSADSVRAAYNAALIKAAQDFILDYGDLISQLGPSEKIVVTNQMSRGHFYFNQGKRTRISVEGSRQDISAFRQGKINRDQALKKLTVVNTETVETREPDMEMLSSIFSRLYRPDLSKTYFVEGNVYYERLKDFGTIYYLHMVSSIEKGFDRFALPTLRLDNLDQKTRDEKVAGMYPSFEQELKENILDYGRTVKSLGDDESLVFNVSLTKCTGCGIPATLELGIKASVLKDLNAGKITKTAAMGKFSMKKGANQ